MKPRHIAVIIAALYALVAVGCAKDQNGHYTYYGPSVGVNAGYQGISVGVAVAGANPATPTIVQQVAPTPSPASAKDGP